jgi:hypothetical protein
LQTKIKDTKMKQIMKEKEERELKLKEYREARAKQ